MEREIIRSCIANDLFYLLNIKECETFLNKMLIDGELTVHEGKFYVAKNGQPENLTLDDFVEEFRALFSSKRLGVAGKMGSKFTVRKKAKRFHIETGYTYEQILQVAKDYIHSVDNKKFVCSADYFFYKQDAHKIEHSRALALFDEIELEQEEMEIFDINE